MCDDSAAQRTRCAGRIIFGKCAQARFTKDVLAGIAHVRIKINIQAYSTEVAFFISSVFMLLFGVQVIIHSLQGEKRKRLRTIAVQ